MILVRVRKFMAREYGYVRRFLSRKDPNYVPGLRRERARIPPPGTRRRP